MVVVLAAFLIVNIFESLLGVWLSSPAKLALAVAVPAFVLAAYVTVSAWFSPPAPVTLAVHGVCAVPSNVTKGGHVTAVVELAFSIFSVPVAFVAW
jgi:hypothetical protein